MLFLPFPRGPFNSLGVPACRTTISFAGNVTYPTTGVINSFLTRTSWVNRPGAKHLGSRLIQEQNIFRTIVTDRLLRFQQLAIVLDVTNEIHFHNNRRDIFASQFSRHDLFLLMTYSIT